MYFTFISTSENMQSELNHKIAFIITNRRVLYTLLSPEVVKCFGIFPVILVKDENK